MIQPSNAGRPVDESKTKRIFSAINEIFVHHGIARLSMERVAKLAGVSKVTLYRRFGSLEGIIEAYVETLTEEALLLSVNGKTCLTTEEKLAQLGCQLMHLISRPEIVAFDNAMAASGEALKALRIRVYQLGPEKAEQKIGEILEQGEITSKVFTPVQLAQMLFHLWISPFYDQLKFTGQMCLTPEELDQHVARTTHFFLQLNQIEE